MSIQIISNIEHTNTNSTRIVSPKLLHVIISLELCIQVSSVSVQMLRRRQLDRRTDIQGDFYELPNKLQHMPFLYNIASNCGINNAPTMKVTPNANLPNLIIPYKQQNKSHQHLSQ